jgi:hypothetical protein
MPAAAGIHKIGTPQPSAFNIEQSTAHQSAI